MKKIFLLFLLGYSCVNFAQVTKNYYENDTVFYTKWYQKTTKEKAVRYRVVEERRKQQDQEVYLIVFYKLDTVSQNFFKEEELLSENPRWISRVGENTFFWENGQKKEQGNREDGLRRGIWTEWYKDGTKLSEHEYFDEKSADSIKGKSPRLVNLWNQKGELIVKDGTGNYFLKAENGYETMGKMVNYKKEGIWQGFRKNGSRWYSEEYAAGEFKQGESWDKEGNRFTYEQISERGGYSEGRQGLVKVISENFKVPKEASRMGIEGTTEVFFEVNKEGEVENIEIAKPLCDSCDQEAIRVVKLLKVWKPGKMRGQLVRTKYRLPFRIKLN
jgi:TonB family protein